MNARLRFTVLTTVAVLSGGAAQSMEASWAHRFVDSVGVNTHLRHARSFYDTQFELMKERLLDARIRHLRDGAADVDGDFFERDRAERFRELGEAGIRVSFTFRPMVSREFVQGFPERVRPAFEAYELPNEMNLQKSLPWAETLRVWMPMFAQYIRDDARSARYPIYGPSIADKGGDPHRQLGDRSHAIDYGNLHKYYRAFNPATAGYGRPGSPPCEEMKYGSLPFALCQTRRISGNKPIVCTEAGYASDGPSARSVKPEIQARYIARMLMLHFKAGIVRTYVYQLADSGTDGGAHMGLLTSNGGEKPAWRQLSALLNELDDRSAEGAGEGAAAPLDIELAGDLDNTETLLFAKRDGSYRLVTWIETQSADPRTGRAVDVPTQSVTLTLPRGYRARRLTTFDDTGAPRVRTLADATPRFANSDNLSIVEIRR
jgi:hypothetical protein